MNGSTLSAIAKASALLAVALCAGASAQNLLSNGDFDNGAMLSGWQFPDATPVWSSFDVNASASSGSAFGTNAQVDAGTRAFVLRQCVSISQSGLYVLGASGYTPTGQGSGNLVANATALTSADCSGTSAIFTGGFFIPSVGQWQSFTSGTALVVPSPFTPPLSIQVSLGIDKDAAGGSFSGYFDRLFLVRDAIFADGFEAP